MSLNQFHIYNYIIKIGEKIEKKQKQKFTTLDRLVMKIFRERGRTSRRGTRSFSSITTAALQNARRVYPAFSSSLFHLSLLLSFRLLSQNPFLPVASSICLGPRFYFYTQRLLSSPHSLFFPLSPPLFTSQLLYPPSLSLSPFHFLSLSLAASPTTRSALFLPFAIPYATLLLLLHSVPDLFYSRDVIAACIFYETSLEAYAHLYPSIRLCCIRLFANSTTPCTSLVARFYPSRTLSLFLSMLCVVINL